METEIKKKRLIILAVLASLFWIALFYRLIDIQVVHGKSYGETAVRQSTGRMPIPGERGTLYDRNGKELAVNVIQGSLFAQPTDQTEINKICGYLDRLFGKPRGYSRRKYPLEPNKFSWIERRMPDNLAQQVMHDSIPGLYIQRDLGREYPYGDVGSQLIGCTNIDGKGISGLEYSYDTLLTGKCGLTEFLRDGQRTTYRLREAPQIQPERGKSIILTIDWALQEIVEQELKAAVEKYHALEGSALFIDCNTGEILAAADCMADGKNDPIKLRAISNVFEPGSVFKVVTAAAILDANKATPYDQVNCENGSWKCGPRVLHDDHKLGMLTFQEVIEKSSNIGTAKFALRVGGEKLTETARKFGFGQRYYLGMPGEAAGSIAGHKKWSQYDVAALAMGHSVSVTALQLAAAIGAVANGGKLYRPILIKGVLDRDGKLICENKKEVIGTVIRPETAVTLRSFLIGVVERGTGTPVKSKIVAIAGKTGTAEVVATGGKGYNKSKFNATFLGFFPANDPKIAGVVVLHQPEPIHYGGYTSGPAFKNIAERFMAGNTKQLGLEKNLIADGRETEMYEVPDFSGKNVSIAEIMAKRIGLEIVPNNVEGTIVWQYPEAGRRIPGNDKIAVVVDDDDIDSLTMADMTGMNLRTAISMLNYQGFNFEISGSGVVINQDPAPGTFLADKNVTCRLEFGRESMDEDSVKELSQAPPKRNSGRSGRHTN
ncbi:conserved hypothetical protein [Candidatus Zixiibacteriota bacterium]|nr:conserved hypothetical protein [candidate division Zixibacteria bacterium]